MTFPASLPRTGRDTRRPCPRRCSRPSRPTADPLDRRQRQTRWSARSHTRPPSSRWALGDPFRCRPGRRRTSSKRSRTRTQTRATWEAYRSPQRRGGLRRSRQTVGRANVVPSRGPSRCSGLDGIAVAGWRAGGARTDPPARAPCHFGSTRSLPVRSCPSDYEPGARNSGRTFVASRAPAMGQTCKAAARSAAGPEA
jgi:hypothetical protein